MAHSSEKLQALVRWLNLVPYFSNHTESSLMEAGANLGIAPKELYDVMHTLTCLGVGTYHGELFDMDIDYRGVHIIDDLGLNMPLRLTPTEASAYLLTLEALEAMPGLVDGAVVRSTARKLREIMDDKALAIYDSLTQPNPVHESHLETVSAAIAEGKQLQLTYWSLSKNETSTRVIDPVHIVVNEDDVYVYAWDLGAGTEKSFRVDRIIDVAKLDTPITPELPLSPVNPAKAFTFGEGQQAELLIHPEFTWLAEYHDIQLGDTQENGWVAATMPIGSPEWFVRFALGNAGRFRVIGPESLRNSVSGAAAQVATSYTH